MKKITSSIIGGLAGAAALNLLHESVKRLNRKAPRVDLIGEEAITKGMKALGKEPLHGDALYAATLASDVLSNAFYYGLIGARKKKHLIAKGITYGALAGIGALSLNEPIGLSDAPVTRSKQTELMTVAYYAFGGLVSAIVMKALRK